MSWGRVLLVLLYSLHVLSNKISPFMQKKKKTYIYIHTYLIYLYLIQIFDCLARWLYPQMGLAKQRRHHCWPATSRGSLLCYLLITSLNNCVNIFEVIKLLILFYFWEVIFSFSTYRGSRVNWGLYIFH